MWQIQLLHFETFWNFFPNVLEPYLVESVNAEPEAMERYMGYSYSVFIKQK